MNRFKKSIFVLLNQFIQMIRVNEPIQKKYICSIESVDSDDSCK